MREKDVLRQVRALRKREIGWFASADALEIHVRSVAHVVDTDRPSFVSDADLDALAAPESTTLAAVELWMAGLWRRTDGGYVIVDTELTSRWAQRVAAGCRRVWAELNSERFIPL